MQKPGLLAQEGRQAHPAYTQTGILNDGSAPVQEIEKVRRHFNTSGLSGVRCILEFQSEFVPQKPQASRARILKGAPATNNVKTGGFSVDRHCEARQQRLAEARQ